MGLEGRISGLECMGDYAVAKCCVIKDACVYKAGLPGPLGSAVPGFAPKNDFSSCKPAEL